MSSYGELIAATFTPFRRDGSLDLSKIPALVEQLPLVYLTSPQESELKKSPEKIDFFGTIEMPRISVSSFD